MSMTTTKEQMLDAIERTGDDPASVVCLYQTLEDERAADSARWAREPFTPTFVRCTVDELPERPYSDSWGVREGEKVLGFSERYVYVRCTYDGSEWIAAVPRHPDSVTFIPTLGGG